MHSTKNNLHILYEDNHLIIINKRSGDISQGDKTGDKPLNNIVKEYIKEKYNKTGNVFLGVVHRLDRPTSGVIIFAKTSKALERLNKMLRDKKIQKTYWAIVKNSPQEVKNRLTHYLKKNHRNNKSSVYRKKVQGSKKSILYYKTIKKLENYSLIEIILETGRHHQIRAQLSFIGFPIKGDLKYGFSRSNKDGSIHLHARSIKFIHPVTKQFISIYAPTPNDVIWNACK
ncbi:MAG: Ribosomal large subunit pseudouridine synthase C [Flavobacterium sp. SCGC AAA160-P02]|nr:MAG: Ribosomal large subunit pseudouridine synthase C [Flavobacterium sp. SCGC AAA160-P02]